MSQRRLPAEIYWRRRLLLVALVIALVWIVLQVTDAVGGDDPKAEPTPAKTSAPAMTSAPAPAVPTAPAVQVDGIVDVALTTATTACDPETVRITPTVASGQLTRGPVTIGLVISSTAAKACTLTPEDADAIAVISANGTPIWDSTVCQQSLLTGPVTISPEWATLASVQWTGRGSGANCTTNEGWATPGDYTIQIGTLGGEPGKTGFTLAARPAAPKTTAPAAPAPDAAATPATPTTPAPDPSGTPAPGSDAPAPLPEG